MNQVRAHSAAEGADAGKKPVLLFVDDEPNILSALRRLFRGSGYQVKVADSGAKGLDVLAEQPADVVVSDMRMPAMNGAEFLGQVARRWPDTMRLLLTGYAEMDAAIEAINSGHIFGYYTKPWEEADLRLGIENALKQKRLIEERNQLLERLGERNQQLKSLNTDLDAKVQLRTAQLQTALQNIRKAHQGLKGHYSDTVRAFAKLVELREGRLTGHARRVAERSRKLALELNEGEQGLQDLVFAALLLQVGKVTLPDRLISRAMTAFATRDRDMFLKHAEVGASVLGQIGPLKRAAALIRQQFEHFDGSGTPFGLVGEQILQGARLIAVVRDYDLYLEGAMTGKKLTASEAQQHLLRQRGKKYDPQVVDLLIQQVGAVKDNTYRPIIEASLVDLVPGMEVRDVTYEGKVFLKDVVLTAPMIEEMAALQREAQTALCIRVRARK